MFIEKYFCKQLDYLIRSNNDTLYLSKWVFIFIFKTYLCFETNTSFYNRIIKFYFIQQIVIQNLLNHHTYLIPTVK